MADLDLKTATSEATSKSTPIDADRLNLFDSAASWAFKALTWANLKATLKTYFDTLYNNYTLETHASDHTNGTDDIQDATSAQKGLATAAQITKLDGIEAAATADQTGSEIKAAYEAEANTNAFTDAEKTLLGNQSGTNTGDQDLSGYALTSRKLDDFGTPDDNTDLNATTTYHGLLPKLGGGTTNYLRADGTWAEPAGGSGGGDFSDGGEAGGADRTIGNTDAYAFGILTNDVERIHVASNGNVGLMGASSFGTSAQGVLGLGNGTAPTTSPADMVQMWAGDYAAGDSRLYVMGEGSTDPVIIGNGSIEIADYGKVGSSQAYIKPAGKTFLFYASSAIFFQSNDAYSGDVFAFKNQSTSIELIDTDGEQSFIYISPRINQSGTAAYNGLKIDVTETSTGDGSTGDGNNLINCAIGGTSKFRIDNSGAPGFFGATPPSQATHISDPSGATTDTDVEARAAINDILDILENTGLMAAS